MQEHNTTTVWSFLQVVLDQVKLQHPHVTKVHYFTDGCEGQYENRSNFCNLCHYFDDFHLEAEWNSHGKSACDGIGGTVKRPVTKASLKRPAHNQILTPLDMFSYCESDVTGIKFFYMSSTTIKENVILLQDRCNAAQTVKGTRQLHRFVPQPQGKLLVYNTSLQASPPKECIIAKTISLSRVQIEDNTLRIDQ